ncbi:hypothetical protein M405DRAFT_572737 [Rhizopogon salebrosus TDB-379]|nr:hypothetical protein M405DRAFT_572737 [Rhizopogon salebrosus TDB-379]
MSTPPYFPGYACPTTAIFYPTSLPSTVVSKVPLKPKPVNVFSNDGSFPERFQRKKKEENKQKAEEALARKRQFDERFRKRGKRRQPDTSSAATPTEIHVRPAKKVKVDATSL